MAGVIPNYWGTSRTTHIENIRVVTTRGKKESALLVVLAGSAATVSGSQIGSRLPPDRIENTTYLSTTRGTRLAAFLLVVTNYPPDVLAGWEDFTGTYYQEPAFDKPWRPIFNPIDRSYVPYVPSTDVIAKSFRRVPYFEEIPPFIKQQPGLLNTDLKVIPLSPSDNTFRARMSPIIYALPFVDPQWKSAWFVPLMPGLNVPQLPPVIFAGAGPTSGFFSGNTIQGYFN